MFRANNFDKLLDKATSNLRLDPDWPTILQICDLIRQNDCTPKYALSAIKKKLYSQNPHQAMFALLTLESIVKNCGSGVHDEVASKTVCEMLRDLVKSTQHENLRNKILELIQAWAFAFRNTPKYRAVQDTVNILKAECFKFPPLKESDAMFSADTAPEWADGEVCHRCRVAFSLIMRRHHCRACGQVFCQQCSSKTSTLPKFGIEKEVRVCDACYDKVSRPPPASSASSTKHEIVDTSSDYGPTTTAAAAPKRAGSGKSAEELQEEEELQLALALSQSEAEQKEKERSRTRSHIAPSTTSLHSTVSPTPSSVSVSPEHSTSGNAELSRYLDRGYWEQRLSRDAAAAPTAPVSSQSSNLPHTEYNKPTKTKAQEDDEEDKEIDEFVGSLKSQVEIFVNRMKSNSSRGRSIANDTAVQSLFMNITAMHSRLLRYIQQQDDKRVYLESLQDKVSQIRDSRAALDTLRAEHAARLAAAAEAADRQRQMQMAAKLQAMRKKKHEYLQYQRQLALQRVQEQEREMQMRQEQQKHQYLMSGGGNYYLGGVTGMHQFQPTYQGQSMYGNPQYHGQIIQPSTDGNLQMPGQPLISQANMQLGGISATGPQMTQAYSITTPTVIPMSQPNTNMQQPTIRQPLTQQMIQNQMLMQQMHQMRLSSQPGAMQMIPQNGYNANMSQVNGQPAQKPNIPGQPNQMMPPISAGQQQNNPMLGVQMSGMRMPIMQPNQLGQVPGYSVNQLGGQMTNMQQPMHLQGQPMTLSSLPGQTIMQNQPLPAQNMQNHIPANNQNVQGQQVPQSQGQSLPQQQQMSQNQPMCMPQMNVQMMQGQPLMSQAQSIPQQMLNQGHTVQGQLQQPHQIPTQGQQFSHPSQPGQLPNQGQPGQLPQQMNQGQQPQMTQQLPNIVNTPQQLSNLAQSSQLPMQSQGQPGQLNQQIPNHGPPGHMIQQMPNQGQPTQMNQQTNQGPQMQNAPQQMQNAPQQMQNAPQQMQNAPQQMQNATQQMQNAPQHVSQGQQTPQATPLKQNFGNTGPPPVQQIPVQPPQTQPNVKTEHNNNTAELINFD